MSSFRPRPLNHPANHRWTRRDTLYLVLLLLLAGAFFWSAWYTPTPSYLFYEGPVGPVGPVSPVR